MDAESKERARDYLAADIFLATVRLGGNAAVDRLPKETLRRARRLLAREMADQINLLAESSSNGTLTGRRWSRLFPPRSLYVAAPAHCSKGLGSSLPMVVGSTA